MAYPHDKLVINTNPIVQEEKYTNLDRFKDWLEERRRIICITLVSITFPGMFLFSGLSCHYAINLNIQATIIYTVLAIVCTVIWLFFIQWT